MILNPSIGKRTVNVLWIRRDYARQWAKLEKEDVYTLSEWAKSMRSLTHIII
jgi:hypothetical protein